MGKDKKTAPQRDGTRSLLDKLYELRGVDLDAFRAVMSIVDLMVDKKSTRRLTRARR